MGLVVGVERSDVAPVAALALLDAGHVVVAEVVDLGLLLSGEHRHDVAAHVVTRVVGLGVAAQRLEQHARS